MVYAIDSKPIVERHVGSSPTSGTSRDEFRENAPGRKAGGKLFLGYSPFTMGTIAS